MISLFFCHPKRFSLVEEICICLLFNFRSNALLSQTDPQKHNGANKHEVAATSEKEKREKKL